MDDAAEMGTIFLLDRNDIRPLRNVTKLSCNIFCVERIADHRFDLLTNPRFTGDNFLFGQRERAPGLRRCVRRHFHRYSH